MHLFFAVGSFALIEIFYLSSLEDISFRNVFFLLTMGLIWGLVGAALVWFAALYVIETIEAYLGRPQTVVTNMPYQAAFGAIAAYFKEPFSNPDPLATTRADIKTGDLEAILTLNNHRLRHWLPEWTFLHTLPSLSMRLRVRAKVSYLNDRQSTVTFSIDTSVHPELISWWAYIVRGRLLTQLKQAICV